MQKPRLQNAYIVARDPVRMRRFYDDVLELPVTFADAERWVQYRAGGANVALGSRGEAPDGTRGPVLVFEVDSFATFREKTLAAGGRVVAERDMGSHGRTLAIEDPEGNVFQLFCRVG